jgi:hypothetical protein
MEPLDQLCDLCRGFMVTQDSATLQRMVVALDELLQFMRSRAGLDCFSVKARKQMNLKVKACQDQLEQVLDQSRMIPSNALEAVFTLYEVLLGAKLLCQDNYVELFQEDIGSVLFKKRKHPFNNNCESDDEFDVY